MIKHLKNLMTLLGYVQITNVHSKILQNKFWAPTTPYVQTIEYGQRFVINDASRTVPIAWKCSKIEDVQPIGLTRLTFTQEVANFHEDCSKHGIANWCTCTDHSTTKLEVCKYCRVKEPEYIDAGYEMPAEEFPSGKISYNGKDNTLRVGGSAKVFDAEFWDDHKMLYVSDMPIWKVSFMDGKDLLCSLDLHFHEDTGWNIGPSDDCPEDIVVRLEFADDPATSSPVDACDVICTAGTTDIFEINVAPSEFGYESLKMRCLALYSMAGKQIIVSASTLEGKYTTETTMEVIS